MSESDIVERLRKATLYAGHGELSELPEEAADEITRLRAREADLTLEGLAHIGRLEAVREVLAGTDIGSLPKDYPTLQMVQDRMAELAALRAEVERLRAALKLFACDCAGSDLCKFPHVCCNYIARAALGDKHE